MANDDRPAVTIIKPNHRMANQIEGLGTHAKKLGVTVLQDSVLETAIADLEQKILKNKELFDNNNFEGILQDSIRKLREEVARTSNPDEAVNKAMEGIGAIDSQVEQQLNENKAIAESKRAEAEEESVELLTAERAKEDKADEMDLLTAESKAPTEKSTEEQEQLRIKEQEKAEQAARIENMLNPDTKKEHSDMLEKQYATYDSTPKPSADNDMQYNVNASKIGLKQLKKGAKKAEKQNIKVLEEYADAIQAAINACNGDKKKLAELENGKITFNYKDAATRTNPDGTPGRALTLNYPEAMSMLHQGISNVNNMQVARKQKKKSKAPEQTEMQSLNPAESVITSTIEFTQQERNEYRFAQLEDKLDSLKGKNKEQNNQIKSAKKSLKKLSQSLTPSDKLSPDQIKQEEIKASGVLNGVEAIVKNVSEDITRLQSIPSTYQKLKAGVKDIKKRTGASLSAKKDQASHAVNVVCEPLKKGIAKIDKKITFESTANIKALKDFKERVDKIDQLLYKAPQLGDYRDKDEFIGAVIMWLILMLLMMLDALIRLLFNVQIAKKNGDEEAVVSLNEAVDGMEDLIKNTREAVNELTNDAPKEEMDSDLVDEPEEKDILKVSPVPEPVEVKVVDVTPSAPPQAEVGDAVIVHHGTSKGQSISGPKQGEIESSPVPQGVDQSIQKSDSIKPEVVPAEKSAAVATGKPDPNPPGRLKDAASNMVKAAKKTVTDAAEEAIAVHSKVDISQAKGKLLKTLLTAEPIDAPKVEDKPPRDRAPPKRPQVESDTPDWKKKLAAHTKNVLGGKLRVSDKKPELMKADKVTVAPTIEPAVSKDSATRQAVTEAMKPEPVPKTTLKDTAKEISEMARKTAREAIQNKAKDAVAAADSNKQENKGATPSPADPGTELERVRKAITGKEGPSESEKDPLTPTQQSQDQKMPKPEVTRHYDRTAEAKTAPKPEQRSGKTLWQKAKSALGIDKPKPTPTKKTPPRKQGGQQITVQPDRQANPKLTDKLRTLMTATPLDIDDPVPGQPGKDPGTQALDVGVKIDQEAKGHKEEGQSNKNEAKSKFPGFSAAKEMWKNRAAASKVAPMPGQTQSEETKSSAKRSPKAP